MGYTANTEAERSQMLLDIGAESFDDILAPIPERLRLRNRMSIPEALDEASLVRMMRKLASKNRSMEDMLSFLGAGIYDHFRPAVVSALAGRGEFATAYTPYQPEMSQGMLQVLYEYQSLVCALTGMDLANASMYDAATALAESALMACAITNRSEVLALDTIHPHYREVVQTYCRWTGYTLKLVPEEESAVIEALSEQTSCLLMQQPNFLGNIMGVGPLVEAAHTSGALAVLSVDPISLGLLKSPSEYDVDIVVGEGQALGNAPGFGGPLLGFFACKEKFLRSFPGRIVGATVDHDGRKGYTMTLRTREQDIRREKATSNICTNQTLLAVASTIYLSTIGKAGIRQVAALCVQKSHYAMQQLCNIEGISLLFPDKHFFKEFAVRLPANPEKVVKKLLDEDILGGLALGGYYKDHQDALLVCVTETRTKEDIDYFAKALKGVLSHAV